jgi:hypothetical protein
METLTIGGRAGARRHTLERVEEAQRVPADVVGL